MAITSAALIARGMNPEQAKILVSEFGGTVAAATLLRMGFSVPLANEIATQKNTATFVVSKLMALGLPGTLAQYIADNG